MAEELNEARKALKCLYLACDASIAEDVSKKVEAAFSALTVPEGWRLVPVEPDDATLETMAKAHDVEDAAQRGEPSPWADLGDLVAGDNAIWVGDRLAAMKAAHEALLAAAPLPAEHRTEEPARRSAPGFEELVLKDRLWNVAHFAREMFDAFAPWTGKTDKQVTAEGRLAQAFAYLDESVPGWADGAARVQLGGSEASTGTPTESSSPPQEGQEP